MDIKMPKNKIALACDPWGYELKEILKVWLETEKNAEVIIDLVHAPGAGQPSGNEQAKAVCEAIQRDQCRLAIMICGTGVGFAMVANMYWGIRAANVSDMYTAERSRKSQNAQVLTIGAWNLAPEKAKKVVSAWYDEPFDWGRKSSVINLGGFLEMNNALLVRPDWVAWSMGFSPEDQGVWHYPAAGQ